MRKSICFITAVPGTARTFLKDHIDALNKEYDVYLVADIQSEEEVAELALTGWHRIGIERKISIWRDVKAVWAAFRYFRKMKFDAVHSVTPKAGLVTALAAKLAGIKHRTHIFTGQVWATRRGVMRFILKFIDKVIVLCDNHIMLDGKSQQAFMEQEGVLRKGQSKVFENGSISGVKLERFVISDEVRHAERKKFRFKNDDIVYVFMGRLNHDKGIGELYEAFNKLVEECPKSKLILYGIDEEGYEAKAAAYANLKRDENFFYLGRTSKPFDTLQGADVFVLPTWREGFGSSVIEAQALGLPVITSDAYGVMDASVPNETGLRCKVNDSEGLYACMKQYYEHPELRKKHGVAGRKRVFDLFDRNVLCAAWVKYYEEILH